MKPQVLIVDDSLTVRMDLEQAFAAAGFAPVLCGDLKTARLALENGPFALVVLDVLLPDGDGIEWLQELKQDPATSGLPVLVLSTEAEVKDRIRGLAIGADDFVGKPYDRGYMIHRAQELLRSLPCESPSRGSPLVLVIDDSVSVREELKATLESRGYAVQHRGYRRGRAAPGGPVQARCRRGRRTASGNRWGNRGPPPAFRCCAARNSLPAVDGVRREIRGIPFAGSRCRQLHAQRRGDGAHPGPVGGHPAFRGRTAPPGAGPKPVRTKQNPGCRRQSDVSAGSDRGTQRGGL